MCHSTPGGTALLAYEVGDGLPRRREPLSEPLSKRSQAARGFYVALPDMQVFMDDLIVEGDRIEFHWTFTGTIAASLGHYDQAEYARQLEHGA